MKLITVSLYLFKFISFIYSVVNYSLFLIDLHCLNVYSLISVTFFGTFIDIISKCEWISFNTYFKFVGNVTRFIFVISINK